MASPIRGKSPYSYRTSSFNTSSLTPKHLNFGDEQAEETDEESCDDIDASSCDEEERAYTSFWTGIKDALGALGQTAKKKTENAFLGGGNFMASRVREIDEEYLCQLTGDGQIQEALKSFIPEASQAIQYLNPGFFEGLNEQTITNLAENLSVHILANFARKVFAGKDEPMPKEQFFGELGCFVLKLFWSHLKHIEEAVEEEGEIYEDLFDPLTKELLDIALPSKTEGMMAGFFAACEKMIASLKIHNNLRTFLCDSYKKVFHSESQEGIEIRDNQIDTGKIKNLETLIQYGKEGTFFFLDCFACHIIKEENAFFEERIQTDELPWILKVLLRPLMDQIQTLIPSEYKKFLPIDNEVIENLIVAFFLTILSSLGRQCNHDVAQPNELFKQIFLKVYEAFQEGQKGANELVEQKKRKRPKYFTIVVDRVLATLVPEHQDFFDLIKLRFPKVFELMSSIMMDLLVGLEMKDIQDYKQRFRTLTWEPGEILKTHATLMQLPDLPTEELSKTFGNEDLLTNVLQFCKILSKKSITEIEDLIADRSLIIEALTDEYPQLSQLPLMEEVLKGLGEALLSENGKKVLSFAQKWICSLLFKGTVHFLENAIPKKKVSTKYLLPFAAKKLVTSLASQFKTIQGNIANLGEEDHPWHVFFVPLSKKLIETFMLDSNNLGKVLPIPEWLREPVVHLISNQILPRLLCKSYREVYIWDEEKKANKETLNRLFGSQRMNEAIRILSLFIPNSIAHLLRSTHDDLAQSFIEVIKDGIKVPSDQKRLSELLSFFFKSIGRKEKDFSDLWHFVTVYCEGLLLKIFADFFIKIEAMETLYLSDPAKCHEGGLLIGLIFNFIEEATAHFNMINQIKNEEKIKHASRVRNSVLIQGFNATSLLHEAMTPEKRAVFFKEKAENILSFLEMHVNRPLPVPNLGKGVWWGLFVDTLLPKICQAIFEKITDSSTVTNIVYRSLKNINDALDSIEGHFANDRSIEIPDDHLQRVLAQLAGELIEALVQLQPSVFANEFLRKYRNFRIKVGEAIAASIRGKIEGYTLLEIVDLLVESALPSLHPGNWVAKNPSPSLKRRGAKDTFVPLRKSISGDVKGIDFGFPKTNAEEKEKMQREEDELKATMQGVVEELSILFDKQSKLTLQAGFLGVWNQFQAYLDREIEDNFGKFGLKIKKNLDVAFHAFFSFFIYPVIKIISFPFIKLTWLIVKCYFKNQAKLRSEDIWSKINENLFFKMFDAFLKILDERNPSRLYR